MQLVVNINATQQHQQKQGAKRISKQLNYVM